MKQSELYDRLGLVVMGMIVGELLGQFTQNLLGDAWLFYSYLISLFVLLFFLWRSMHHKDKERARLNSLDLVDLVDYEQSLIRAKYNKTPPVPVPPIAQLVGRKISTEDRLIIERNRDKAQKLLRLYFPEQMSQGVSRFRERRP